MKCQICHKEFRIITWKHLWYKHNMKIEEYDALYGQQKHGTTKVTPESIKKAVEKKRGQVPWNKGLTKDTHPSLAQQAKTISGKNNPVYRIRDRESWIKNIKSSIKEYNLEKRGKTLEEFYGLKKAKKIKKNLSEAALRRPKHAGHHVPHTIETKNRLREITTKRLTENKGCVSQIQKLFYEEIKKKYPEFNFILEYFCKYYTIDVAIPEFKIALEVDGDFWHVNEERGYEVKYASQRRNMANDKNKEKYLKNRNWKIIRFWESDIKEDIESCFERFLLEVEEWVMKK